MQARKTQLAVAAGMSLVVFFMLAGCASTRPAGKDRVDRAAAEADRKAAQPAADSRSMYHVQTAATPAIAPANPSSDNELLIRPVQMSGPAPVTGQPSAAPEPSATSMSATSETEQEHMPVFSIKEDLKNTPRWLWEDTKRVYTSPLNLGLLLAAGGASIAVHQHVDWTFDDKFRQSRTCKEDWGDAANAIGYPPLHLGIAAAWYFAGYEFKDLKTYNVGKNLLSALIITDLSTVAFKAACADTEGPRGQHFSWPSGHTSSTFAMAAVLDQAYGHVVGVPMYALAGWVGFERMDDHQHMFSDVLFGAMLGAVIGNSVATGHLPQIAGGNILPYADPEEGSAGLVWWKSVK